MLFPFAQNLELRSLLISASRCKWPTGSLFLSFAIIWEQILCWTCSWRIVSLFLSLASSLSAAFGRRASLCLLRLVRAGFALPKSPILKRCRSSGFLAVFCSSIGSSHSLCSFAIKRGSIDAASDGSVCEEQFCSKARARSRANLSCVPHDVLRQEAGGYATGFH